MKKIFISGVHKTPHAKKEWNKDDVSAVFAATVAAGKDIPLVLGHPKDNLPVVGWLAASALKYMDSGDKAVISVDDSGVTFSADAIKQARKAGADKLSVKIDMATKAIKHVGLVSRAAVDELNDATFADGEEPDEAFAVFGTAEVDALFGTNEYRVPLIGKLLRGLRDIWIEKFGKDEADKALPATEIDWLMDEPRVDEPPAALGAAQFSAKPNFQDMTDKEKIAQLEAELQTEQGKTASLTSQLSAARKGRRDAALDAVFSAEENKGKITDKNLPGLRAYAETLLPVGEDDAATFSATDDRLAPLRDMLAALPVVIPQGGAVATFAASAGEGDDAAAGERKLRAEMSAVTGDR